MTPEQLIEQLKRYDTEEGYGMEYAEVKKNLEPVMKEILQRGDAVLDVLHPLLEHEETWSCCFALEILEQVKSEQSIPHLIAYIERNGGSDYSESCETPAHTLTALGSPAVTPLLASLEKGFEERRYQGYLSEALSRIDDTRGSTFRLKVLKDYLSRPNYYGDWFVLTLFLCDFTERDRDAIPFLKQLREKDLTVGERCELESALEFLEDPEGYHKRLDDDFQKMNVLPWERGRKIGRNDPCPCGSGKKYKRCCSP